MTKKEKLENLKRIFIESKHSHVFGTIQFNDGIFEKKCIFCGYQESINQDNSRLNETFNKVEPQYYYVNNCYDAKSTSR